MATQFLRYSDLKACGIVGNWVTLARWIEREGFPPGRKFGPNTRVWTEAEVEAWIESRPIAGGGTEQVDLEEAIAAAE
jgi:predicted DNA-binding transcriptional regulator AlpA